MNNSPLGTIKPHFREAPAETVLAQTAPAPAAAAGGTLSLSARGRPRLGETLIQHGLLTQVQLDLALNAKRGSEKLLGEVLVELGFITDDALSGVLAEAGGFERYERGSEMLIDPELTRQIPREIAEQHRILPLSIEEGTVRVAMVDPFDERALEAVRRYLPLDTHIDPKVCAAGDLHEAIDAAYGFETSIEGIVAELNTSDTPDGLRFSATQEGYVHPIVRLVNAILLDCTKRGASEVHLEPEAMILRLRYRIEGTMVQVQAFNKNHFPPICHRLKLLAGLNIAERSTPQFGSFSVDVGSRSVKYALSTLPTTHGETLVLRILGGARRAPGIDELGLTVTNHHSVTQLARRGDGMILVSGPSGSGKTTTVNALLKAISAQHLNMLSVEEQIESNLPMMRQTQVGGSTGLSRAEVLRAALRQSPDVINLDSLEDPDTALVAQDVALAGVRLLTTIRAGNVFGAIHRLIHLGFPPPVIAHHLGGVIHQRLVRALCPDCRQSRRPSAQEAKVLGLEGHASAVIYEPVGCKSCGGTGHRGLTLLAEILVPSDALRDAIADGASQKALRQVALQNGYKPLAVDGIEMVRRGLMSLPDLIMLVER